MNKTPVLFVIAALAALGVGAPAQAEHPHGAKAPKSQDAKPEKGKRGSCEPRTVGYNASGTLTSAALTPGEGERRYNGTLQVDVKKANHHGATGPQTFTLTNARVRFGRGVDAAAPAAGSRVKVHGKTTKLRKHCSSEGFTPEVTVRKVDIRQAKPAPTAEATKK